MPITLAQLAQVETDPLTKLIILNVLRNAQVMEKLPFENVTSLQVRAYRWESLPTGGAFRSINEGYTSVEDGQLGSVWEAVYGFGGDLTFDTVLEKITNVVKDPVQIQTEGKLKSMSLDWNNYFINGDHGNDPKGFEGLKKRIAGMPSRQTVYATPNTTDAPLDPTASAGNARRMLNQWNAAWRRCNSGQVSAVFCNEDWVLGLTRVLQYLQTQGNFLDITKDSFDREIVTYRGVPFFDMGLKKDQSTEIISTTETAGDGGADSTSVYLSAFNTEEGLHGIQMNNLKVYDPLNGGEMESKPSKMKRVDWWNGLANFGSHGMVRLRNIARLADWTQ
jgi:hypothetical protein